MDHDSDSSLECCSSISLQGQTLLQVCIFKVKLLCQLSEFLVNLCKTRLNSTTSYIKTMFISEVKLLSVTLFFLKRISLYVSWKCSPSCRYEDELPGVDIFVCTADPILEPPSMVMNTVLSVMAYNYPPEKLSVYLSDDGCSELTFYALLEASKFSKYWIPFCKKFAVEPSSPEAYFNLNIDLQDPVFALEWGTIKVTNHIIPILVIANLR